MILRFRSKNGMTRVQAEPLDPISAPLTAAGTHFGFSGDFYVSESPATQGVLASTLTETVNAMGLVNGALLYITEPTASTATATTNTSPNATTSAATTPIADSESAANASGSLPPMLPVDVALDKEDGLIARTRSNLCRHGDKGMCEYCSPLPPWDKEYLAEKGIKHTAFWAHVKQSDLAANPATKSASHVAPLDTIDYRVNTRCINRHAPYPAGFCSKCQPAAITLQQQPFRLVDHVEFADHAPLNRFIDAWRQSGSQRYGVLYGHYERFDQVPLGIKAVVEAIYEPPQAGEADGITLLPWERQNQVDEVAQALGLAPVGVVFTDLTDSGARDGSVLCKRHKDSFFLSGLEVVMAARNQHRHRNRCTYSASGWYSSKFVTCVITGNRAGEIEPRAYQVSAGAEALVEADLITALTQPLLVYINPTEGLRYVPEVFYSEINEYGLQVKTNAKPAFPVDFLLVTLLDSFPLNPTPMFALAFPPAHRDFLGEPQNLHLVRSQLAAGADFHGLVDFHFLVYVHQMDVLSPQEFAMLVAYVRDRNDEDYVRLAESGGWMTLLTIVEQST